MVKKKKKLAPQVVEVTEQYVWNNDRDRGFGQYAIHTPVSLKVHKCQLLYQGHTGSPASGEAAEVYALPKPVVLKSDWQPDEFQDFTYLLKLTYVQDNGTDTDWVLAADDGTIEHLAADLCGKDEEAIRQQLPASMRGCVIGLARLYKMMLETSDKGRKQTTRADQLCERLEAVEKQLDELLTAKNEADREAEIAASKG